MNERIFDERGAASYLGGDGSSLLPRVLADWRFQQRGPRFFRLGRAIRYAQSDLDEFRQAHAITPHRVRLPPRPRKLSPEQFEVIAERYSTGLVPMRILAAEFNVSVSMIALVVRDVVIAANAPRRPGPPHKARDRGQQAHPRDGPGNHAGPELELKKLAEGIP
jgi:hypothetical protein